MSCILGQHGTGWLVRKGGEKSEATAGARILSHGVLVQPHPSPPSDSFIYALLVLPLPFLIAAAQLIQMHDLPFASFPALVLCVCKYVLIAIHRTGVLALHLVPLRVSACLAHRVGWCRESSGTSVLRWFGYSLALTVGRMVAVDFDFLILISDR
ncbi:hypothetical protein B0H13DRAFT_2349288 [Mycena leptocephala]|nr:hypothetical protein B0H13DRAFT_2349288 [Mycena leptocephala]